MDNITEAVHATKPGWFTVKNHACTRWEHDLTSTTRLRSLDPDLRKNPVAGVELSLLHQYWKVGYLMFRSRQNSFLRKPAACHSLMISWVSPNSLQSPLSSKGTRFFSPRDYIFKRTIL